MKINPLLQRVVATLSITLLSILVPATVNAATSVNISSPSNNASLAANSFTVSGTATPNRTISVSVNGTEVGTATSNGSGSWSLDITGQNSGTKTIEATATGEFIYSNILNAPDCGGGTPESRMSIINTLDNSEESNFSIFRNDATAEFCPSGGFPITWKPNPAFTKAYGVAPYLNSSTVFVMDLVNGSVSSVFDLPGTGQRGASVEYNEDGSRVYITDNANTTVYVYNTTTEAQVGGGISIGNSPHSNTKRPGSDEIWVANSADGTLAVINTNSNTVTDTHNVGGTPNGMAFSPDGSLVYIGQGDDIDIIDADSGNVIDTITGTNAVEYLLINSDGSKLYASHPTPGDASIDVFDLSSNTLEDTVTVADGAWGMALTADEDLLYVASPNLQGGLSGTDITVINTSDNTVVDSFTPGNGAPFHIFTAPAETATDSVEVELTSASSTLASTGKNVDMYYGFAVITVVTSVIILKRKAI